MEKIRSTSLLNRIQSSGSLDSREQSQNEQDSPQSNSWRQPFKKRLGVKEKTTAVAVALAVIPTLVIGGIATYFANQVITERTLTEKQRIGTAISLRLNEFVRGRLHDVETIANSPFVGNAAARQATSQKEIIEYFDAFTQRDPSYAQIATVTPDGNFAFLDNGVGFRTTKGTYAEEDDNPEVKPFVKYNVPYYYAVKETLRPAVAPLRISPTSGKSSFYVSAPSFNKAANQLAFVVYSRTNAEEISKMINQFVAGLTQDSNQGSNETDTNPLQFRVVEHAKGYFEKDADGKDKEIVSNRIKVQDNSILIDGQPFQPNGTIFTKENRVFVSNNNQGIGTELQSTFPKYTELRQSRAVRTVTDISKEDGKEYLLTYIPVSKVENLSFDWGVLVYEPTASAFAPQRTLTLTLLVGTAIAALIVGAIAALLANQTTRPLLAATSAVERIGQGELDTRVDVKGDDEIALLGVNINNMAGQIKTLLQEQAQLTEEQRRQKELLQERALELLDEVDPINEGDLTVRAR
ncbi:MAG TPA: HAMP domain-containing protein, partial [Allocoleopsis sp.]